MTANQVYKLSGSDTPFSEWVGEQKIKYGEKFVENEEFINMNGEGFIQDTPPTAADVVMQNSDENIQFPRGAAIGGSVSLGGSELEGNVSVSNFPTKKVLFAAGVIVVGLFVYNKYIKK